MEKDQSLSTINSIKRDRVSHLSNERIVDLMEGLDVESESTDKDVSIVQDSEASIYQPLETRLERVLGTNEEYNTAKKKARRSDIRRKCDGRDFKELLNDLEEHDHHRREEDYAR